MECYVFLIPDGSQLVKNIRFGTQYMFIIIALYNFKILWDVSASWICSIGLAPEPVP